MGSLELPDGGTVYVDSQILIYTVEQFPQYLPLIEPLWEKMDSGHITVITSQLAELETIVVPIRNRDKRLMDDFEMLLASVQLKAIDRRILRQAAQLRASYQRLKTPDAIHAATALIERVDAVITNDSTFRNLPGLVVMMLDDYLS